MDESDGFWWGLFVGIIIMTLVIRLWSWSFEFKPKDLLIDFDFKILKSEKLNAAVYIIDDNGKLKTIISINKVEPRVIEVKRITNDNNTSYVIDKNKFINSEQFLGDK